MISGFLQSYSSKVTHSLAILSLAFFESQNSQYANAGVLLAMAIPFVADAAFGLIILRALFG